MKTINIATDFHHRLVNRDERQGDGSHNAIDFREKFLSFLDDPKSWLTDQTEIILDFTGVEKLGPSFANEAFAYFTKYAKPSSIKSKISFINISNVKNETIDIELKDGYSRS